MKKEGTLLIIDDNSEVLLALKMLFDKYFKSILTSKKPDILNTILQKENIDVIILDMNFEAKIHTGNEGFFWLNKILEKDINIAVIFITAYGNVELAVKGIKKGATDFITKPWDNDRLITTVLNAYKLRKSRLELNTLKQKHSQINADLNKEDIYIPTKSPEIKKVLSDLKKASITDANILLLGENGTGKSLFARKTHMLSERKNEIFVDVDLGSIPETLFETELFGHVKGAFTDAKTERPGRFEISHKGTLFLDEISNIPITLQAKLLRIIQTREVNRIGSNHYIKIDNRIISASNRNPYDLIKNNLFREDLLFRLNTVQIEIPPLRYRKEDIPLLINHFIDRFRKKYKKPNLRFSKSTINKLTKYDWPGNIRQLEHTIENTVILSDDNEVKLNEINLKIVNKSPDKTDTTKNLHENEKKLIEQVVRECKGNLTQASKVLGITRATLYRKIEKYEI